MTTKGYKYSAQQKKRMSDAQKRTRHSPHTEESKRKMSIALTNSWIKRRGYAYQGEKDMHLRRKFGISQTEYDKILKRQKVYALFARNQRMEKS